jgi:hypothetical protein
LDGGTKSNGDPVGAMTEGGPKSPPLDPPVRWNSLRKKYHHA